MQDFARKRALITGAASGIGRALALEAAHRGMHIVACDVAAAEFGTLAKECTATGAPSLETIALDVRDSAAVEKVAAKLYAADRGIDVLFNNAGVLQLRAVWEHSTAEFDWLIGVNLLGVANGLRAFVPRMLARGTPAHIVNTGSVGGFLPAPSFGAYGASKAAIQVLTEALHHDLRGRQANVGVSLLCPGAVQSKIFDAERFAGAGVEPLGGAASSMRDAMRDGAAARGLDPRAVAIMSFDAVAANRFWIFPHPKMLSGLADRGASIAVGETPHFEFSKTWRIE